MMRHRSFAGYAFRRFLATTLSVSTLLSVSAPAFADEPASASPPATGAAAHQARIKEATTRFERGLALYDDGDFGAALVEFNRAYELAPTYKVLYNIAKIERLNNDYSAALTNYQRYLDQGGEEVPAERRAEVEKEIAVLKARVALITVKTNVVGAAVYVDGNPVCTDRALGADCVGTTPLRSPVIVNPGKRTITASKRGYMSASAQLNVAGGDQNTVKLDLFDLHPRTADTGPRDRAIVAWSVTGALAIGAGVMGALTLSKKSDYDNDRALPPCANQTTNRCLTDTSGQLASDKSRTKTFAAVTDVLTGAAVIGGAISIYFTVKASNKPAEQHAQVNTLQSLRVGAGLGSAVVTGSF